MVKLIESSLVDYVWNTNWKRDYGQAVPYKEYYPTDTNSSIIGTIYLPGKFDGEYYSTYGAEIYDNEIADIIETSEFDTESEAKSWVESRVHELLDDKSSKNNEEQTQLDFEIDDNGTLIKYNGFGGDVVIPDGVTSIGDYAFSRCTSLTSITIPDGVTSIGYSAFSRCTSLTIITIPDGVTSIGDYAFYKCTSLTIIKIPNSVTSIGDWAFSYCISLTSITIPNSVTSIGDGAFYECKNLTGITIPNSVTNIGGRAFEYCERLTSIRIPDSVTRIKYRVFYGCSSLTNVAIPNSVKNIEKYAFSECTRLKSVVVPRTTDIDDDSFPSETKIIRK